MTRVELEQLAQAMGVPLEQAAAMLGESSLLGGHPPPVVFNPENPAHYAEKARRDGDRDGSRARVRS
ncbi:MAG TPA: hypothetical protein VEK07_25125 [Polyangiaceae bacterium]|nr:hypothetical protein [Polyangiaceae bacterium]